MFGTRLDWANDCMPCPTKQVQRCRVPFPGPTPEAPAHPHVQVSLCSICVPVRTARGPPAHTPQVRESCVPACTLPFIATHCKKYILLSLFLPLKYMNRLNLWLKTHRHHIGLCMAHFNVWSYLLRYFK